MPACLNASWGDVVSKKRIPDPVNPQAAMMNYLDSLLQESFASTDQEGEENPLDRLRKADEEAEARAREEARHKAESKKSRETTSAQPVPSVWVDDLLIHNHTSVQESKSLASLRLESRRQGLPYADEIREPVALSPNIFMPKLVFAPPQEAQNVAVETPSTPTPIDTKAGVSEERKLLARQRMEARRAEYERSLVTVPVDPKVDSKSDMVTPVSEVIVPASNARFEKPAPRRPQQVQERAPVTKAELPIGVPAIRSVPETEKVRRVAAVSEKSPEIELSSEQAQEPPDSWLPNGKPEWGQGRFECLLFTVSGLKLAVPLVSLGAIHTLDKQLTPLFGHPGWFLGLMRVGERNVQVVDTAQWVMPDRYKSSLQTAYRYVIRLNNSQWGMACDQVAQSFSLTPDDVRWRTQRSKRPWLAGTVIEHMCALMDAAALAQLLDRASKKRNSTI